jgi:RNA polymerase sigma factor (sigma-70 family)
MDNEVWRKWKAAPEGKLKQMLMNKLVMENEPLAHKFLTRLLRFSIVVCEHEDLVQAARCGLWEAIKRYNPDRITRFSTMAWHWVRYYVGMELAKQPPIRRPRGAGQPYKAMRSREKFVAMFGREPSAADLGVTEAELQKWQDAEVHFAPLEALEDTAHESVSAEQALIDRELDVRLHEALERLPEYMQKVAMGEPVANLTKKQVEDVQARVLEFLKEEIGE